MSIISNQPCSHAATTAITVRPPRADDAIGLALASAYGTGDVLPIDMMMLLHHLDQSHSNR